MALPDSEKRSLGTSVVWGGAGGTGVTATLSLNALADNAGRMGASVDLGADFEEEHLLEVHVETGTAPTAGTTVEVYLAWSRNNTDWPGKVTGADAAYPATVDANKKQLGSPAAILVATADGNTVLKQNAVVVRARGRYVAPVVVNKLGQAFRNEATASDNDSRVILTPLVRKIVE
ncbi:MAG TPA: hypothetical protein VNP04_21535 [Alphaproteobacteria bacterium]|nr:hypothetical protein [Alphaproteobacteria bacterium]